MADKYFPSDTRKSDKQCGKSAKLQLFRPKFTAAGGFWLCGEIVEILGPSTRIQVLGVIADSRIECLELPLDKLAHLTELTDQYSEKQKLTREELEVILGHTSFAEESIYPTRNFLGFYRRHALAYRLFFHLRVKKILRFELF